MSTCEHEAQRADEAGETVRLGHQKYAENPTTNPK
jgi:hypothetical protein